MEVIFCQYKWYFANRSYILQSCSVKIICSLTLSFDILFCSAVLLCSADSIYPINPAEHVSRERSGPKIEWAGANGERPWRNTVEWWAEWEGSGSWSYCNDLFCYKIKPRFRCTLALNPTFSVASASRLDWLPWNYRTVDVVISCSFQSSSC